MRRIAKQDREDNYASKRDYQEISRVSTTRIQTSERFDRFSFCFKQADWRATALLGFGGFIKVSNSTIVDVRARHSGGPEIHAKKFDCGVEWSRLGFAIEADQCQDVTIDVLMHEPQDYVDIWGWSAGMLALPEVVAAASAKLNVAHLLPESLYFDHETIPAPKFMAVAADDAAGSELQLKKCSYCGRRLPVGPGAAGRLSFHKHNDKPSGHQNECRSCKKWRINDTFNPIRTPDQLNESSLITRERRLLLREPQILRSIKERNGRGLKSIVWDRFGRKCFCCKKPLKLKEVQLDHTRPLAYLWPIDSYATCLCAEHNNHKKDQFPVDFYSAHQLKELSAITGLSLAELEKRSVCAEQLQRIREDIASFALRADPRAFNSIARKVIEIEPSVDLWAELLASDAIVHQLVRELADLRPTAVGVDIIAAEIDDELSALEE
ncbi:hypothetical protein MK632_20200 [Rhizobium changzhiense]|uniref:hypothetical protein n=1 Tax=Rhizobium changzhiense TaxID=2692317 RepID=UPI001F0CD77D|nr:hypothetical protein [Rhizobium changzhiense]MCH4548063.1 hypothetical protein [Rhizobium changzhiense]